MAERKYDQAYVEKLERKLYETRAELVSIANQVGFILKEVGSSPVKLVPMDQKIIDTTTLVSARSVRDMNWRKLVIFTLTRAQESKKFKEALKTFAKKYNLSEKKYKDIYNELKAAQSTSEREKDLEKKVREIAHNANEAINEKELLTEIQYDLIKEGGKKKFEELGALIEGNGQEKENYIRKLNIALDERDKAEGSRRSALGWNTRYKRENEKLKKEIKKLKGK